MNSQRKFLSNLLLVLLLNFLVKPFWIFGIDRTVQNTVGAEVYGSYFSLLNLTFLLNILLDFGITNFNNRTISQNNQVLAKYFSGIASFRLFLGIFYMVILLLAGLILNYSSSQIMILSILGLNQFLLSFILYLRSNISGLHLFKTDSLISVCDRLIMIFICGILLWGNVTETIFQIEWFIYAQTIAYFITSLIAIAVIYQKAGSLTFQWNLPFYLSIIKQSMPYAILIILMMFYYRVDGIMLERMLNDNGLEAGIYAQSFRLLDAANIICYLFAGLLLPMFSKMLKTRESIQALVMISLQLLLAISIGITALSVFYSKEILELLYTNHIEVSYKIFPVLMSCFVPLAITYVFGTVLTANGNLKLLNYIALGSMMMNVTLNYFLIPEMKGYGSALASLITQSITSVAQVALCMSLLKIKLYKSTLISAVVYISVLILTGFSLKSSSILGDFDILLFIGVAILTVFISRLISLRDLFMLFKQSH